MNILVTGAWNSSKEYINQIENMNHNVFFLQNEKDQLPCRYDEIDGVVANGLFIYHPIDNFSNLKYIQLTSAGFDRAPMEYIIEKNILINNAKGVYSIPMAEMAVLGVLELYKNSKFFIENQKNHVWEKNRNLLELSNKVVVIVGTGDIGTECAKRFYAFECKVVGVDLHKCEKDYYEDIVEINDIDNVISKADIVVLTLPLSAKTYHLFNSDIFNLMKKNTIIVNISRGKIIDEFALTEYLKNGKIGGAVLDVFDNEPLSDSELWDMHNVIITPHNSFVSEKNEERLSKLIIKNLIDYTENLRLHHNFNN